jgi:hypothetical protein
MLLQNYCQIFSKSNKKSSSTSHSPCLACFCSMETHHHKHHHNSRNCPHLPSILLETQRLHAQTWSCKGLRCIEWPFIVQALRRQGFRDHFIDLVRTCMETTTFSVLINDQPFGPIHVHRGIRQGCPLSPYIFVLAINELSIFLQQALQDNHPSGIKLGPDCPLYILFSADDLIICRTADPQQAQHTASILHSFCNSSGQTPNRNKSSILFSKHVDQQTKDTNKSIFPIQDLHPNTIHLGHPIIINNSGRT